MKTRMEKYYNEEGTHLSRATKNASLYKEVNTTELEDFRVDSNVSVLGDNTPNIKIDELQELLDKKYHEEPKRKTSVVIPEPERTGVSLNETREYDINEILNKAKETKEVDYEVERLKKVHNTQFDILNSLNLDKEEDEEDSEEGFTEEQAKLMELINTIASKEMATQVQKDLEESDATELDPLDLFTDLKGDDDATTTLGAIKEELLEEAKKNSLIEEEEKEDGTKTKEYEINKKATDITGEIKLDEDKDSSFYNTGTIQFAQSDFDDFNDLKDDMKAAKIIIKILIVLVIIAFVVGCVFLANNIFNLGLL